MLADYRFIQIGSKPQTDDLAEEVARGLGRDPKALPSRLFYDARGSHLFELITELPEYYPTRTERSILETNADRIVDTAGAPKTIIEFGSGSSAKTRLLLKAALKASRHVTYVPIDISGEFLRQSAERLMRDFDGLSITALAAEYFEAFASLPHSAGPRLFVFLGSNIGNFEPVQALRFLRAARDAMQPGDRFLVGIDLKKDLAVLQAAYDDAQGVTAEFNKNVLARINRELGGHFDLNSFQHKAVWVERQSRIEMHLVSLFDQIVRVDGLDRSFAFRKGESIHTENSHKYAIAQFEATACGAGLCLAEHWTDRRDWFALTLLEPAF